LEVLAKLFDGTVEGFDRAVRAGDHNAAFHDREDVSCEGLGVGVFGQPGFDLVDALANGTDPALKVFGDKFVGRTVFGVDFEGEAAKRTAISAFGLEDAAAVACEDAEDALDGLVGFSEGGIDDHGAQGVEITFKDFAEQSLFAFKEVVEAAGVDLGVGEEVGHTGAGEPSFPKEVAGGVDEAIAGGKGRRHGRRNFLTELVYGDLLERPTKKEARSMKKAISLALVFAVGSVLAQSPANIPPAVGTNQALVIEVMIPAPISEVWKAFSTSQGLSTWLTPNAVVELREGGEWTAHFPGGSTGGGTIVSFVPEKELVLSALAPDKFPTVRATRTRAKFSFEAKGDATVVRLTQTGWKDGEEWVKAYEYLTVGNAQLLATLHHRFVNGPIDWTK
jgi:uncharacterized protein YndB with AHSA1/START domain